MLIYVDICMLTFNNNINNKGPVPVDCGRCCCGTTGCVEASGSTPSNVLSRSKPPAAAGGAPEAEAAAPVVAVGLSERISMRLLSDLTPLAPP